MSNSRRSLLKRSLHSLRKLWRGKKARRELGRQMAHRIEALEPRLALTHGATDHIHPVLTILIEGDQIVIPPNIGLTSTTHFAPHTHDFTGSLHFGENNGTAGIGTEIRPGTVKDFFDVWRTTDAGPGTNNPNAILDTDPNDGTAQPRLMDKTVDANHVIRMYVNGQLKYASNLTNNEIARPELYSPHDLEQVVVSYDAIATAADSPSFDPIANRIGSSALLGGAPLYLALDGFDANGGPLTYSVTSGNSSLVQATIAPGNRSLRMDVDTYGVMTYHLFDDLVPDFTNRIVQLVNTGFYNRTQTNQITFHRVIDGFVIQAGDPTGTGGGGSPLGDFDDQFHADLQHTSSGLMSMAKAPNADDNNDSQFFVTDASTRSLDFNHSIFARLVDGDEMRDAINSVPTDGDDKPLTNVIINSISVVNDTENAVLKLKAAEGATGTTTVTVTVSDAQGHTFSQTFQVTVTPDTSNSGPFLDPILPVQGALGQPIIVNLEATDLENDALTFSAQKPTGNSVNYTLTTNPTTGQVTINPPTGFVGTFNVLATVRQTTNANTTDQLDRQLFSVTVAPGTPTVDLLAASDTGISNSDNITNASELSFVVTDVTNGANVELFKGATPLGNATATGNSVTIVVTNPGTALGEGVSAITARQTTSGQQSPISTALNVTYDTTQPADFTSAAPTAGNVGFNLNYNAEHAEEGSAGFQYSLVNGPGGSTINATTGVLSWTPTTNQLGTQNFSIVATDAAGNTRAQQLAVAVSPAVADLSITLTRPDGTPLTSLSTGQEFILHVFAEDVRDSATGVFAAFLDITWDGTKATVSSTVPQVQQISFLRSGGLNDTDPDGGTFRLGVKRADGTTATTGQITYSTTAATTRANIQTALDTAYGAGVATVTSVSATVFNVTYANTVGTRDIQLMSVVSENLTEAVGDASIGIRISQGALTYTTDYPNTRKGDTSTSGVIEEAGAVGGQNPLGEGKKEVFSVRMRALTSGNLNFTANTADATPANDILLYGANTATPDEEVHLGSASINIAGTFDAVNDSFTVQEDSQNNVVNPLLNDASIGGATNVLTITTVGNTSGGGEATVVQNGTRINYTPATNFAGADSFTYTVRNENNETHTATITMTVSDVNDPPDAVNDTFSVPRNSQNFVLNVLANDQTNPDSGETLRVTVVGTGSAGGTLTIGPNNADIRYTPANNFSGTESFTYTISDRATGGQIDQANVTVTINGVAANNDNFTVAEDSNATILDVLLNDTTDPQFGGTLTITGFGTGSNGGTIQLAENATRISYRPAADFQGVESFTYTINDGQGHSATGTANVTVTNSNDPPVAVADSLTGFRNTTSTFDVLANDTSGPDPTENLTIDVATLTQPANGQVSVIENGKKISFIPTTGFTGTTSFTYVVRDPSGGLSTPATATINVAEFAPSTLSGFVYFDVNNNGQKDPGEIGIGGATITLTGTPTTGSAINQTIKTETDGSYKFENLAPGANFTIAQSAVPFTIDGRDTAGSQGGTTSTNDRIVIANLAQATTGINNNFGERGRVQATLSLRDLYSSNSRSHVLAALNGSGAELWHTVSAPSWQTVTDAAFSSPSATELQLQATNGQSQQFTGRMSTSSDDVSLLNQSSGDRLYRFYGPPTNFTLTTTPVNQAPVANADNFTATEDTALTPTTSLLANDTDPESNTLTASIVSQPAQGQGTVSINSTNGTFTYTPTSNFFGTTTFTYRVSDGANQSAPATVTITVTGANDAPVANADSFSTPENTTLSPAAPGLLTNDTDPDGDTRTAVVETQPAHGDVTIAADGSFTYVPDTDFDGPDSFTYRARDASGAQSTPATVTITVVASNQAPTAANDTFPVTLNTPIAIQAPGVLQNDTDPNGNNTLTAVKLTDPASGQLTFNSNGSFTYEPNNGFQGTDSFTYRATDGTNNSTATVVLSVTAAGNQAPTVVADSYPAKSNTTLSISAPGVLQNDTDPDSSIQLVATQVTGPSHGSLTLNSDGSFTYIPNTGVTGPDSFTYAASDGTLSSTATVNITIAANDAPNADDDTATTTVNTSVTVTALGNDEDPNTDTLTVTVASDPPNGTATINTNGTINYQPNSGFSGTDSFTYTISDGRGGTDTATITITVTQGGGEGEGSTSALDAALLDYLESTYPDDTWTDLSAEEWQAAVDHVMALLA